jgi:hypothetical protein
VREGERIDLRLDRVAHALVAVPETRHRSAARCVQIAPAFGVDEINALPSARDRKRRVEAVSIQSTRHRCSKAVVRQVSLRPIKAATAAATGSS